MLEFVAQNDPACVPQLRRHVREFLHKLRIDPSTTYDILLATDEAASNAVAHGQDLDGNGLVRLRCSTEGPCVVVAISDEGPGFDPEAVQMHRMPSLTSQGGRGLFLVKELMDDVQIDASETGTVIEMKREVERPRRSSEAMAEP